MKIEIDFTNRQFLAFLRQAVEDADQTQMEAIVAIIFQHYDFHKILPDDLLTSAARIASKRHNVKFKMIER